MKNEFDRATVSAQYRFHGATHAWFIGYAPAGRPRYAVSVIVENRGGGGVVAAPVAKFILEKALKLKDADPLPAE